MRSRTTAAWVAKHSEKSQWSANPVANLFAASKTTLKTWTCWQQSPPLSEPGATDTAGGTSPIADTSTEVELIPYTARSDACPSGSARQGTFCVVPLRDPRIPRPDFYVLCRRLVPGRGRQLKIDYTSQADKVKFSCPIDHVCRQHGRVWSAARHLPAEERLSRSRGGRRRTKKPLSVEEASAQEAKIDCIPNNEIDLDAYRKKWREQADRQRDRREKGMVRPYDKWPRKDHDHGGASSSSMAAGGSIGQSYNP